MIPPVFSHTPKNGSTYSRTVFSFLFLMEDTLDFVNDAAAAYIVFINKIIPKNGKTVNI